MCKIIIIQALYGKETNYTSLDNAADIVLNKNVDVINFSLSTIRDRSSLKERIKKLYSKNILMPAALANDGSMSYPAMYKECISVASFRKADYPADVFCDDRMFSDIIKTGNSMACALISGVCALAKSYDKTITKEQFLKQLLGK